jgi:hypothetical protein
MPISTLGRCAGFMGAAWCSQAKSRRCKAPGYARYRLPDCPLQKKSPAVRAELLDREAQPWGAGVFAGLTTFMRLSSFSSEVCTG